MNENEFVKLLQKLFEKEGFLTQREIGVGYGVADLVFINKSGFNRKNCTLRKRNGQISPLLGEEFFKTLSLIPDEHNSEPAVEFDYIAKKSSLSRSYLKYNVLRELENKGYVKQVGNQRYFKINGWLPITNEIIAIEAKLKDWKRGAIQANRYKAFANRVYLAVPKETARLVDTTFLRKHNIGLISLNVQNLTKRFVVSCKPVKPFDEYKSNFAAEHFWSRKQLIQFA